MQTLNLSNKVTKKPKLYYYRKFSKTLSKDKDSIANLKRHYKKEFITLRLNYVLPLKYNFDSSWNSLVRAIEQYLDVLIIPYTYVQDTDSKHSVSIIGAEDSIIRTTELIHRLYYITWGTIQRKTREVRLLHRRIRRRHRKNNTHKLVPDARTKISSFKSRLLSFLETEIRKATADLEKDPKIKIRGRLRRKRIKSYIWRKYKRRWKSRL
jgi:hypothetical protein